jgi:phosphate transport system protein
MTKHDEAELEQVLQRVLHMGQLVEVAVEKSLRALLDGDAMAATEVVDGDDEVDAVELEIEEQCIEVLARRQPLAKDLRLVTAILKINSDLERIGDLAVNIAERSEVLALVDALPFRPDVSRMAAVIKVMVRQGLEALVQMDPVLALHVWDMDVEPDRLYCEILGEASHFMRSNPARIGDTLHLLSALRNLERIGDHATNIAEDVIYMVEGQIVRHRLHRNRSDNDPGPSKVQRPRATGGEGQATPEGR